MTCLYLLGGHQSIHYACNFIDEETESHAETIGIVTGGQRYESKQPVSKATSLTTKKRRHIMPIQFTKMDVRCVIGDAAWKPFIP